MSRVVPTTLAAGALLATAWWLVGGSDDAPRGGDVVHASTGARLAGRLVLARAEGVEGVRLSLRPTAANTGPRVVELARDALDFTIAGLAPGAYEVRIELTVHGERFDVAPDPPTITVPDQGEMRVELKVPAIERE
jgi:hypothetical protein